jgi:hypothetical protein
MFAKYRNYGPDDIHRLSMGYLRPLEIDIAGDVPRCEVRVAITYTNRIFHETALGLQQALQRTGGGGVEIWGDTHHAMNTHFGLGACALPLQIAIGPHEETMLLPRYVVYHMEQSWSMFMTEMRYQVVLVEALAVWIFSEQHRADMQQLGVRPDRIHRVPMLIDASYLQSTRVLQKEDSDGALRAARERIDIVLFGSSSKRRRDFANGMMLNASLPPLADLGLVFEGSVSGAEEGYFGQRRDALMRRAKASTREQ